MPYSPRLEFMGAGVCMLKNVISTNNSESDVTKHRTVRTGPKYRSWVLVKCVWCGAYY